MLGLRRLRKWEIITLRKISKKTPTGLNGVEDTPGAEKKAAQEQAADEKFDQPEISDAFEEAVQCRRQMVPRFQKGDPVEPPPLRLPIRRWVNDWYLIQCSPYDHVKQAHP